jgi:tetratricopeptide (TPR) repeat protein
MLLLFLFKKDPDVIVNEGCILFKEGKYDEALEKFNEAINSIGKSYYNFKDIIVN